MTPRPDPNDPPGRHLTGHHPTGHHLTEGLLPGPDTPASPAEAALLAVLREGLGRRGLQEDLVDVAWAIVPSPIGELMLAATPHGLVRVVFAREGFAQVRATLAARLGARVVEAPDRLADAAQQLREYFAGQRRSFDVPLDLRLSTAFRAQVQRLLPEIGYGATVTYTELAARAGRPRAVRAVGTACATNPLPVVVPCHRVLRTDGTLGGYLGGLEAKAALLRLEGAA